MQGLSAARILQAWERGHERSPTERALALLAAALPDRRPAELAALSLGQRDMLLLRLRELTLGPELRGYTDCPRCGVTIDFKLRTDDLWDAGARAAATARAVETLHTADGFEIDFRLPDSRDTAAAARCADLAEARTVLLTRTVLAAHRGGQSLAAGDLPESAVLALAERIEARDPMAETPLALHCARCGNDWQPLFDIAAFLWSEVAALAERLLFDTHTLARFYGWSETEILNMSAARRDFYLQQTTSK
jgi:hypothetical protein